jgi:predicted DNA-binding transcriptional regulator YafY
VEADLSLINLVNFGGGTYALFAQAGPGGVDVVRDVMAETFSRPARLSPVMARALLLALDLIGDTFVPDGLESLASVREKVHVLVGADRAEGTVIVDDVLPPDPQVVEVLNRAVRDHCLVELEYFTFSRQELRERVVEPYLLFHSPDGWYVEGYCLMAEGQRTFKLERIRSARTTGGTFVPRPEMDLTRRRAGEALLSSDVATWATVRFHPRWRTYLEESGTECLPRPDGGIEVRMPYLDERWVVQEIVRYLGDAVLQRPASARRSIKDSADALAARYGSRAQSVPGGSSPPPDGGDM